MCKFELAPSWGLTCCDHTGLDSALLRAVASEHATAGAMVRDLLKMGASPSSTAPDGATGLHIAAIKGDEASTLALLEGGAVCDALSKQGVTPLFYAAMQGHTGVMRVLLENGADVRVHNESRCTPLFLAAHEGHADVRLLPNANTNVLSDGMCPGGATTSVVPRGCERARGSGRRRKRDAALRRVPQRPCLRRPPLARRGR